MRKITIKNWGEVDIEGDFSYTGQVKPKEQAKVSVEIKRAVLSCEEGELETEGLESEYLKCDGSDIHQLGSATSALDCTFDIAFSLMADGETAVLNITHPGKYFSGNHSWGSGGSDIPDTVTLMCTAHMKIVEVGRLIYEFTPQEKLSIAVEYKNLGICLYKEGTRAKQVSAFFKFCDAVRWLAMIETEKACEMVGEIQMVKTHCYNNIALHHLHEHNNNLAVAAASKVLLVDCVNVKALYRRAVANTELQNYELALSDIKAALVVEPSNKTVKQHEAVIKGRQRAMSGKYAAAMRQYFL